MRDGFIGVGEALSPAVAEVVTNYVATAEPIVLEGDGILLSLLARPDVRAVATGGRVRAVFVVEPEEEMVLASMAAHRRGMAGYTAAEVQTRAQATWLYGQWLAEAARHHGVPVLEARPWTTLVERIIMAIGGMAGA